MRTACSCDAFEGVPAGLLSARHSLFPCSRRRLLPWIQSCRARGTVNRYIKKREKYTCDDDDAEIFSNSLYGGSKKEEFKAPTRKEMLAKAGEFVTKTKAELGMKRASSRPIATSRSRRFRKNSKSSSAASEV